MMYSDMSLWTLVTSINLMFFVPTVCVCLLTWTAVGAYALYKYMKD